MINLANHNAEVQLDNKFELIARDESRTIKAIEELESVWVSKHQ